ncbi:MAG: GNAT family N-acetyltransferase [Clostridiales bacterium]|jgi:RimJ/RimL family protein N-acetyltransferase|nr:GNAT family N-acetyltransferase [Clostridiales bacterium]
MIVPLKKEFALIISGWKYEGNYAVYSFERNEDTLLELLSGNYYACLKGIKLIGYYCFGSSARIPTLQKWVYDSDALDIGLGMAPSLCGRGLGYDFLRKGMEFAAHNFKPARLRLTVAEFNERAARVYERAGFRFFASVKHLTSGMPFNVMVCDLKDREKGDA